ncbi:MAG: hypothetical protein PHV68_07300 [Candidatus Gastranaerophilales bacterium]|nr:hypothetical protein [Candidatus Gastranaerophilales bacterium]
MTTDEKLLSVASPERLVKILEEAKKELLVIEPEIKELEEMQKKLTTLKRQHFKLNSLITSLKSIIGDMTLIKNNKTNEEHFAQNDTDIDTGIYVDTSTNGDKIKHKIFLPDVAVSHVKNFLRTNKNLNYEIFKAVVFNSGTATTENIRNYLVENNIKQPKTGKGFKNTPLKEISSRANYLVRKNILISDSNGTFRSVFGWTNIE